MTPKPAGPSAPFSHAPKAQFVRLTEAQSAARKKAKAIRGVSNQVEGLPASLSLRFVTAMRGDSVRKKVEPSANVDVSGRNEAKNQSAVNGTTIPIGKNHQYSERDARPENWNDLRRQVVMAWIGDILLSGWRPRIRSGAAVGLIGWSLGCLNKYQVCGRFCVSGGARKPRRRRAGRRWRRFLWRPWVLGFSRCSQNGRNRWRSSLRSGQGWRRTG